MSGIAILRSLELRSKVTARGRLELWLEDFDVPEPAAGELVVRIDAAPINPSDMILIFAAADLSTIRVEATAPGRPSRPPFRRPDYLCWLAGSARRLPSGTREPALS
jgi:hypothetical protein